MCLPLPPPPAPPPLPAGISITAPPLPIPPSVGFCCKVLTIPSPPVNVPLFGVNSAAIAALNTTIKGVFAYLDALSLGCPLD